LKVAEALEALDQRTDGVGVLDGRRRDGGGDDLGGDDRGGVVGGDLTEVADAADVEVAREDDDVLQGLGGEEVEQALAGDRIAVPLVEVDEQAAEADGGEDDLVGEHLPDRGAGLHAVHEPRLLLGAEELAVDSLQPSQPEPGSPPQFWSSRYWRVSTSQNSARSPHCSEW
jgi:hypothetical protein